MLVRIRLGRGPTVERRHGKNRQVALALGTLLTPLAAMALALGMWRLAADLKWAGEFAIPTGLFSHWQVWIGAAIALQLGAWLLNRYGRGEDEATP